MARTSKGGRCPTITTEHARVLAEIALRYLADMKLLPEEPKTPGRRALYARDLNELHDGLALRLEGALTALRYRP